MIFSRNIISNGIKPNPKTTTLREGTKKVHIFKDVNIIVKAPENKLSWMPEKISKPFIKKDKIENRQNKENKLCVS